MRLIRMFFIIFQDVVYNPAEAFVYFLMAFINPLATLIFWNGAFGDSRLLSAGWTLSEIRSYYLLLITAGAMLLAHIEWVVAYEDIYQGYLSFQLLRPFRYLYFKLLTEIPWRFIQGILGMAVFILSAVILSVHVIVIQDPIQICLAIIISLAAFGISFLFKMIVGLTALWTTDYSGIQQLVEVGIVVLAGFVLPLSLYPKPFNTLVLYQPFAYVIYYPILAWIGKIPQGGIVQIIGIQGCWLLILFIVYQFLWRMGVKKFTGVGN